MKAKLMENGLKHPVMTYEYCMSEWERLHPKAKNSFIFDSVDKMENWVSSWVRPIQDLNLSERRFIGSHLKQHY